MGKILVTGGAGFIGSHVAEYFAKKGNEITVFDNLSRTRVLGKQIGDPHYNWNYLRKFNNIKFVRGDVRDFSQVKGAAKNSNVIIHAAAQVAVTISLSDPRIDFETNALGTFNVLEAARLNDSSMILCSTNKVYGENVNKIPVGEGQKRYYFKDDNFRSGIPEDFPIDLCSHSPYGCSKLVGDLYAQDYAETFGLRAGVFRMSCIFGERQFGVEDQGWVAWFTIATLTGMPITIYGDGKQVRDVLYVEDLVRAFDLFLSLGLKHEVFNMGGGPENVLSLLELLSLLEELTGRKPKVSFDDWRPADQKVYVSDISKAKRKLGWGPKVAPREGVKRLVEWFADSIDVWRKVYRK
ncbi:MAG: NAD-dependent epimerase/dehydratase family protein [Candidatus Bathyarchaeia archaeon]